MSNLKGKKIIITAGPVWVPVDDVRVMTNVFGGKLGYYVAKEASREGADVLLLMGPGRVNFSGREKFKIERFKYFEEIFSFLKREISTGKYDCLIQSAAIPDYVPKSRLKGKTKSGKANFNIEFKPTVKIIDQVKKWDSKIFLVKFKLEVDKAKEELLDISFDAMKKSDADLMVANEMKEISDNHRAYIINKNREIIEVRKKDKIAKEILKQII